ncbi:DNA polymerase III subunit alpha [Nonomuraea sp. bgisy101]|uniref:DNA polymerase III subunit alpha n=1 Tax=Nonomuraea sp. bgisy101 TaxID=3413784 RepID=UPI003D709DB6
MLSFPHLHVSSAYSMRYGTAFPQALVRRAAEHGMDILALTDRDGLYGALKHAQACMDARISPVFGVDFALDASAASDLVPPRDPAAYGPLSGSHRPATPGGSGGRGSGGRGFGSGPREARPRTGADAEDRVTVLARSGGWSRLCRLVTAAHYAGARGEPKVTRDLVGEWAAGAGTPAPGPAGRPGGRERGGAFGPDDGLVVLLGPRSDVGRAVAARRDEQARALLDLWRSRVRGVVIELVDQYGYRDATTAVRMLSLAEEFGVPAVLTNAARYLDPADHQVGDVLDAARQLVPLHPRHLDRSTSHAYLKSGDEMRRVAHKICGGDQGRANRLLYTTRALAEACVIDPRRLLALSSDPPDLHLPEIGRDPVPLLRHRCENGLDDRGLRGSADARDRLEAELAIIEKKRLSGYFMAVVGITDRIRQMGIRCAIRGSGAGSLVNYLIGIGEVNPLHHGLLMERFLSEGRIGLPDIDIDVESARRLDCYKAIYDMYGESRVACVSMMETYRARSALRDVGGAMGLPPHEIDAIAKAFPHIRARQITASLKDLPELRESRLDEAGLGRVFQLAEKLDGLPRHIALHPCGVLVGNSGLRDRTPVERSALDFPMSQFDKDDVEEAGLLKLDVLGVRMQSAMAYTLTEIKRVDDVDVELDAVPQDDERTYDMICASRTLGCFQIESPGQRELVAKLEPRTMDDLIVDISLFRPGPVNSDMVTPYLESRHGWRAASYPHPRLRAALAETNGVVVFHEQVLKIIDAMTGAGLSEAEKIRRSLGDPVRREASRRWFLANVLPDYDQATVERAWQVLDAFGAFGFCKAHAAAFALPTYQSAWLKRHHAAAFFAGVLTHEPGMYPQRVIIDEARQCGVTILPLDVNKSAKHWTVERVGPPPLRVSVQPSSLEGVDYRRRVRDFKAEELGRGYGLRVPFSAVKGVSEAEVDRMVAGRPYTSLADFWDRARPSRPVIERLVQVGGFDALHSLRPGGPRWRPGELTRRDLIAQVGVLERASVSGVKASPPARKGYSPSPPPGQARSRDDSTGSPGRTGSDFPGRSGSGFSGGSESGFSGGSGSGFSGRAGSDGSRASSPPRQGRSSRHQGKAPARGGTATTAAAEEPRMDEPLAVQLPLGFAERIEPGELPEMTETEMVEAELEILGIDVSRHVMSFHDTLLDAIGVVRSKDLLAQRNGAEVLVAGVKVATQTPAVRSGQRVIFTTLDDSTGPVDLTFFESVQGRCASTVFGSWLMVARGVIRRTGTRAISMRAVDCWNLVDLDAAWRANGLEAVLALLDRRRTPAEGVGGRTIEYANGYRISPYSDIGPTPGVVTPPRRLWHASQGSSGPTQAA